VRASLRYAAHAARSREQRGWKALTAEQAADVEAVAGQIFPTDETPGAREAHVGYFIDHSLATWAAQQREAFTEGLAQLNAEVAARWPAVGRFAKLSSDQQIELLRAHEKTSFFRHIRLLTLVGMFSLPSYGGNADKVGWQLIGFEDRFAWQPPFGTYDADVARDPR
jgi:gluconate 2-dehydrogenase gamma chain